MYGVLPEPPPEPVKVEVDVPPEKQPEVVAEVKAKLEKKSKAKPEMTKSEIPAGTVTDVVGQGPEQTKPVDPPPGYRDEKAEV